MKRMAILFIAMSLLLIPALHVRAENPSLMSYMDAYDNGKPFRAWSIDKQYAFAQELPQLIKAAGEEAYITPSMEEILSHRYGLPSEQDLTQDEAQHAAMAYLISHAGETMDKLQGYTWTYSFYVDHEASPE